MAGHSLCFQLAIIIPTFVYEYWKNILLEGQNFHLPEILFFFFF